MRSKLWLTLLCLGVVVVVVFATATTSTTLSPAATTDSSCSCMKNETSAHKCHHHLNPSHETPLFSPRDKPSPEYEQLLNLDNKSPLNRGDYYLPPRYPGDHPPQPPPPEDRPPSYPGDHYPPPEDRPPQYPGDRPPFHPGDHYPPPENRPPRHPGYGPPPEDRPPRYPGDRPPFHPGDHPPPEDYPRPYPGDRPLHHSGDHDDHPPHHSGDHDHPPHHPGDPPHHPGDKSPQEYKPSLDSDPLLNLDDSWFPIKNPPPEDDLPSKSYKPPPDIHRQNTKPLENGPAKTVMKGNLPRKVMKKCPDHKTRPHP